MPLPGKQMAGKKAQVTGKSWFFEVHGAAVRRFMGVRAVLGRLGRRAYVLAAVAVLALLAAPTAGAGAPTPVPPQVELAIDSVQSKPEYERSDFGLLVADRDTGEILINQNSDKLFTTGSIMKTFTASTVLSEYGTDYRFRTKVFRRGKVNKRALKGNLVLAGAGDYAFGLRDESEDTMGYNSTPTIDHSYADTGLPGPTLLKGSDPLRGVTDLARDIRKSGIREVKGNVVVDDRLFKTYKEWPDGDISPVWLNENLIDAEARPTKVGKPAKVHWRPKTSMYKVVNRTKTGPKGSQASLELSQPKNGKLVLSGRIPLGSEPLLNNVQVGNPSALVRTALIDALKREGVNVKAKTVAKNPRKLLPGNRVMKSGKKVGLFVSRPMSEMVKVILKVSFNRGADLMACLVAVNRGSRTCEDGLLPIYQNNTALGVPDGTTYLYDGAGSDDRDRTSPGGAVALLDGVLGESYGQAIYDGLPIYGVDGTFRVDGLDSPAKGKIRAKSGNRVAFVTEDLGFVGAQTRMGFIETEGGRNLIYADLINNVPATSPLIIFDINDDMDTMEVSIQQGY
jgi:D-alanyl-D-alanine carboxypeptidase/D-alanyl-D-alanine-endopeptidase (penicillin-binding protein 4)